MAQNGKNFTQEEKKMIFFQFREKRNKATKKKVGFNCQPLERNTGCK